jgi:hypothetical protein
MTAVSTRLTRADDFARRAPRKEAGGARLRRSQVEDVSVGLVTRIRELSVALLGERNTSLSSTTEWRWRGKGSLSLAVTGARAGCWFDHEAGSAATYSPSSGASGSAPFRRPLFGLPPGSAAA